MDLWVLSRFVKPGHIVLDAGANIGFTCLLAKISGAKEIHGFEPDPRLTERLKANCRGEQLFIHEKALSDESGSMQLRVSTAHNQGSTLSGKIVEKFPEVFKGSQLVPVEVVTIDEVFQDKNFDLFKVDVEGAELAAIKGAALMLKKAQPSTVYIEAYEEFFDEIHEFLQKFYGFFYRIVCDRSGNCCLFPLDTDFRKMQREGFYTMPPSYIYSVSEQEELTKSWTQPLSPVSKVDT
nr:FkbM family methyltransferase [Aestuariicella hydrocarbonica]